MRKPGRKKKQGAPYANILFWLPIGVIVLLVIVALNAIVANQNGTVVVRAVTSGRYSPQALFSASYTIGSARGVTPTNISLGTGPYTVIFGSVPWFKTPPPKSFYLPGGKTYYATGVYDPVPKVIAITSQGLNATKVAALHGVTPVVWVNWGPSYVVLEFQDGTHFQINPSQNYTRVFDSPGNYSFDTLSSGFAGEVDVQ